MIDTGPDAKFKTSDDWWDEYENYSHDQKIFSILYGSNNNQNNSCQSYQ